LRSLHEDVEIDDKVYQGIRLLYDEARADVNAGLTRVLAELESTSSKGTVEQYDRVAQRAANRATDFIEASDNAIFGKDRGLVDTGVKFVDSLAKALVEVWKVVRNEKAERHALLIQRITSLKWNEFLEIK
jgi:hypothetical protein